MSKKSRKGAFWSLAVMLFYLAVIFGVPIYVTQQIFQFGPWLAQFIVYMVVAIAIGYGIKVYRVDLYLYRIIRRRFGVRIY